MTPVESARAVITSALAEFRPSIAVLTSFQREGMVIVDLVQKLAPGTPVLTIDTGRLPEETDQMISRVEERYQLQVERVVPDSAEVTSMIGSHGADLFHTDVPHRMLCCNVRKVRPLAKRLTSLNAYFTGLRRSQSDVRAGIEIFDRTAQSVKISPLADWSVADVAAYTLAHQLPEHPLYGAGYTSIGCGPCTRAVTAGEEERAGRWWWETDADRECGLHFSPDGKAERYVDVLLRELVTK